MFPVRVIVLPDILLINTDWPSPRSIPNPSNIPMVLSILRVLTPGDVFVCIVVDATIPPSPTTPETWVPVAIPVPDNGEPIMGAAPVKANELAFAGVLNCVSIVPALPLL